MKKEKQTIITPELTFNERTINISELKSGIYFIRFISQNNYQIKQIVKN